jgi:hypothetical protein
MKVDTKKILKEQGKLDLFTDERFELIKAAMRYRITKDPWLKNYLSLDPFNKAQWCADHLVQYVESEYQKNNQNG